FPFLYGALGGAGWDAERARLFDEFLAAWGSGGWLLPFSVTFDATFFSMERFDGIVGPVFLLGAPLVLLAIARSAAARSTAALALLLAVSWALTTRQVRFLLPALAVFAALLPAGWEAIASARLRACVRCAVAAAILLSLAPHALLFTSDAPLAYAVGRESAEAACARNFPGGDYALFRDLARAVPPDGKILFAGSGNPIFYCERAFRADSVVENHTLRRLLCDAADPAVAARRFAAEGFTHLLFRQALVFGPAGDLTDAERTCLAGLLARHGRLELRSNDTVLYRIEAAP
ncbi:MAG: hypothetical protein L0Z55_00015, partial [Planctomycetes bacterium]|nr:hypothetical protein [Planctomycetota bacterium]